MVPAAPGETAPRVQSAGVQARQPAGREANGPTSPIGWKYPEIGPESGETSC